MRIFISGFFRWFAHWTSRKNCCGPVMGLVTVFWPAITTGAGELVTQAAGETRLVVDCKVNPAALVGQVKTIPLGGTPESKIVSCGGRNLLRIVLLSVSAT